MLMRKIKEESKDKRLRMKGRKEKRKEEEEEGKMHHISILNLLNISSKFCFCSFLVSFVPLSRIRTYADFIST